MKICEYCGKEFEPKQQRSKYCSRLCQVYGCRSQEKTSICQCCGREHIQKHGREKYCSDDCRIKTINEKKKEGRVKTFLQPMLWKWLGAKNAHTKSTIVAELCVTEMLAE